MPERVPMTSEGKQKLQEELTRMKTVERPKIVKEIEVARGHGDLSENAEYHAAKERQGHIEGRIQFLEDQLSRCEVVFPSKRDEGRVVFGVKVRVVDVNTEKEFVYRIVGDIESDIEKGYISIHSPIAKALIGKREGDTASLQAPGGKRELEIMEILAP